MTVKEKYSWPEERPKVQTVEHTWFGADQEALFKRFAVPSLKVIVECGTWLGGSSRRFYEFCPNAEIYTIDSYSAIFDFVPEKVEPKLKGVTDYREIFFASNWDFRDRITQINESTYDGMNVLKMYGIEADLVYVDAGHDFDNCFSDILLSTACWPRAQIIGDDYDLPGVKKAVDLYAKNENVVIDVYNNKTWAFI